MAPHNTALPGAMWGFSPEGNDLVVAHVADERDVVLLGHID
jgi:hypothetical protein